MAYDATACLLLLLWRRRVGVGHGRAMIFLDFGARSERANKKASRKKGLF